MLSSASGEGSSEEERKPHPPPTAPVSSPASLYDEFMSSLRRELGVAGEGDCEEGEGDRGEGEGDREEGDRREGEEEMEGEADFPLELRDMDPLLRQYLQSLTCHAPPAGPSPLSIWRDLQTMAGTDSTSLMSCDSHVTSRVSDTHSGSAGGPAVSSASRLQPLQESE